MLHYSALEDILRGKNKGGHGYMGPKVAEQGQRGWGNDGLHLYVHDKNVNRE